MMQPAIGPTRRTRGEPQAGAPAPGAHDILIGMTVPLMGGSWQRDRIVLGDGLPPAMAAGIARGGKVAITLAHADTCALALAGEGRISLAYDPAEITQARAALIAASAQGGWPVAGDPQSLALLTLAERIAASDIPVLLEGPTGKGLREPERAPFFAAMSSRAADGVRDEIDLRGRLAKKDVAAAQKAIVEIARGLADAGEIVIGSGNGEFV